MWTTATLGKFTNNSTWTMWNIFVGTCKDYFSLVEASSKVFKNRRESRWNATLNEPVPRLIWRFVWDLTQKSSFVPNKRPESISLLSQSSYTKKFTRKLDCSPYMFGSCKGAFFSENGAHKSKGVFQDHLQRTPRQNVYACARLSISGHFFSHTFQSKSFALGFILCTACGAVVLLYATRVFDYWICFYG